jgi:hypothetical protein
MRVSILLFDRHVEHGEKFKSTPKRREGPAGLRDVIGGIKNLWES